MFRPSLSGRLPRATRNGGLYFGAVLINALGYGLFVPFSVLYFHQIVGLSLPLIGLGLSIATGVGLVATPLAGPVIDRFGARSVAVVSNALGAAGFAAYLSVHSFGGFLAVAIFLAAGRSGGSTAGQALVVDLASPEERDRWYAIIRMAFNAGAGLGALLASLLVAGGGTSGYRWIVGLNGVTFTLAAVLVFLVRVRHKSGTTITQGGSYRIVLRDRPFLGLAGINAILWVSVAVLEVGLPPYLIVVLHAPVWLVGLLFTLNTGMIVVLQLPIVRLVASWRRTHTMALGGLGWGASFLLFAASPLVPRGVLPYYMCACMIVYTLAEIIYAPTTFALAAAIAPDGLQGRYLAIYQLSFAAAATVTPTLAGSILAANPQLLWPLLAVMMSAAAALIFAVEGRLPRDTLNIAGASAATDTLPDAGEDGLVEPHTPIQISES